MNDVKNVITASGHLSTSAIRVLIDKWTVGWSFPLLVNRQRDGKRLDD